MLLDKNMSHHRKDGKWTIGMLDFDILVPDTQMIGCAAKCGDKTYPKEPLTGGKHRFMLENI